ncbi:hypothetical protein [Leptodesmis sp.]|uniref:hypothetical protein n=1 Tax=Leptodesmis sp. TaxID=3100501 RepID=UPI0040535194
MPSLIRFVSAFNTFCNLLAQATLAPSTSVNGWSLDDRDPEVIRQLLPLLDWFYHDYFHVQTSGWEHIPATGRVLLIGSHNGGMVTPDLYMVTKFTFRVATGSLNWPWRRKPRSFR